jgi:iron complex transport system ATP-binding protein
VRSPPTTLEIDRVTHERAGRRVLSRVSLTAAAGEMLAVVGPNGAGKSTLARVLGAEIEVHRGTVRVDGRPVVALGRRGGPGPAVGRPVSVHSGCGIERWLPWAAHSAGPVVVLDDPVGALDPGRSRRVLDGARAVAETGRVVIVTMHDLTLAGAVADRVLLMASGRILADGPAAHVLTPALLELAYGAEFDVVVHPSCGHPIVLPPAPPDLGHPEFAYRPPPLALVARDGALVAAPS